MRMRRIECLVRPLFLFSVPQGYGKLNEHEFGGELAMRKLLLEYYSKLTPLAQVFYRFNKFFAYLRSGKLNQLV